MFYHHFYVILIFLPILKKTVNAVYTIFCKSYDGRGRQSITITNLVVIKQ